LFLASKKTTDDVKMPIRNTKASGIMSLFYVKKKITA